MIKYVIHAKEWRDKINGNSYHSATVLNTQNNLMLSCPFTYGYGDQFLQTASNKMLKEGWIKEGLKSLDYLQIHNIIEKNCKKKDVIEWGQVA
jgi:hypothetical protein|tara:strand:+ start:367 stop:645 length:279 start_codon:yes stop_codon:yes gene_type:complete